MTPTRSKPAAAGSWPYAVPAGDETPLGISLSGGGIRSATFSLGAYQSLLERGTFGRARYLSAVSGGCYLAGGVAISHAMSTPETCDPPPWGRGSPEESRLRRNLSYLAPGGQGRLWLIVNLVYGLIMNLTPLVLGAYLAGRVTGFALRAVYPGIGVDDRWLQTLPAVAGLALALVAASIALVGILRFRDKEGRVLEASRRTIATERHVSCLLAVAGVVVALGIVVPAVVHVLAHGVGGSALLGRGGWQQRTILSVVAVVAVAVGIGAVAVALLRRGLLPRLRGVLGASAGISVLAIPFLFATETGALRDVQSTGDAVVCAGALVVVLLFAVLAHNRRYSMHLFYRERIQDAFASRRVLRPRPDGDGAVPVAEPIPYAERIMLSDVARRLAEQREQGACSHPELVICAAVTARGTEVPSKAWAASFTFEGERSGNRSIGLHAPTKELEEGDWIGGGGLTLPSMMAISGAALSPVMGRFTLPAFRFLMAMLNIRLGVWVRNPRAPRTAAPSASNPVRRLWRYVVRGWHEPGAWYVLKEALGLASVKGKFIYISDGGHWENLGVTELLRRRCTNIIVVDASGDAGLGDIGRAIAVARAELGVEIRLDPYATCPGDDGLAASPVAVGSFEYPDGQQGQIYFARCVLWAGAPTDLQLLAARDRLFPSHPTGNQFLSGELFDAYRALGWAVAEELDRHVQLPSARLDERLRRQPGTRRAGGPRQPVRKFDSSSFPSEVRTDSG
jgi:hypothetical protein